MFPTLLSLAQIERVQEIIAAQDGRTVAGVELVQPFMTSAITVTVVFDNGEDAEPRYEIDAENSRTFLVCGKDVTDLVAEARANQEQADETVEVQA